MLQIITSEKLTEPIQSLYQRLTVFFEGKKPKSNIASLDGVRAIACLVVIAFHLSLMTTKDVPLWSTLSMPNVVNALAFFGDTGVTLFFVLSGFLLFIPYARAMLFDTPWPSLRQFYLRRALRILPAYYVTLILMILIWHPEYVQWQHLPQLFLFLTLFMDSSATTFKQINGPFWTLAVEWQFYLWLPLLAYGMRLIVRRGALTTRFFRLTGCLFALAAWGVATRFIGIYITNNPGITFGIPSPLFNFFIALGYGVPDGGLHGKFLEDFAPGMFVCALYVLMNFNKSQNEIKWNIGKASLWLFGLGLCLLFMISLWKYDQTVLTAFPFLDFMANLYQYLSEFSLSVGFSLCVLAILFGPARLRSFFEWRILRWLGLLSFGLYMWHLLLLQFFDGLVVQPLFANGVNPALLYVLLWFWFLVFVIPCVFLLHMCVEKPCMQFMDRFRGKVSTRTLTEPAATSSESPVATLPASISERGHP